MDFTTQFSNINKSNNLPPSTVRLSVKKSEKYKIAIMDAFEQIAVNQRAENILKFYDHYRMVNGNMSYQELREVVPYLKNIMDLFPNDNVEIKSILKHYDLLGMIKSDLVGKYTQFQDKYHVTDTGEIAQNEFLRHLDEELQKGLNSVIENEVNLGLAQMGIKPDGQKFSSEQEQQQYQAQLESKKAELTPKDTQSATKSKFKTIGVQWGEATMDQDRVRFDMLKREKKALTDTYLSGRWFRLYDIKYDSYDLVEWDTKDVFFSKEMSSEYPQDGEYVGRITPMTPTEVIHHFGHRITTAKQKELLGGNEDWKNFVGGVGFSASIEEAVRNNFNRPVWVPFANYADYKENINMEDYLGVPMGEVTFFDKHGKEVVSDRYLPRYLNSNTGAYSAYAKVKRGDFDPRMDLCMVTEVYHKTKNLFGYLTYEDSDTGRVITEEVTEEILPDFLKENNITASYKEYIDKIPEKFEVGTIYWFYKPVVYKGLKIQSGNLDSPLYPYYNECDHQIKGESMFDVKLPVAGLIGEAEAKKVIPFQIGYNLCMNQIHNMLEKEVGIFFAVNVLGLPSDAMGWGDAEQTLYNMRNIAKEIGILPIKVSPGDTNTFTTHNLTYQAQIQYRAGLAEMFQKKAFEAIGTNPLQGSEPSTYVTAEGVKVSNEAKATQVADFYETFEASNKKAWELHLSVAQYCQSNEKDITIYYTKSDASLQFLKMNDPNFPLRNIGLVAISDPKRRKEFELFRQALIQRNTVDSGMLEFAGLWSSDTMTEAIDIAIKGEAQRAQQEQLAHDRQKELITLNGQNIEEQAKAKFQRDKELLADKIKGSLLEADIMAKGRAADKDSDITGFDEIDRSTQNSLRALEIGNKQDIAQQTLDHSKEKDADAKALKMAELKLKTEELLVKRETNKSNEQIAYANKN